MADPKTNPKDLPVSASGTNSKGKPQKNSDFMKFYFIPLCAAYPWMNVGAPTIAVHMEILGRYSVEQLKQAARMWIDQNSRFPAPSEIREIIQRLPKPKPLMIEERPDEETIKHAREQLAEMINKVSHGKITKEGAD